MGTCSSADRAVGARKRPRPLPEVLSDSGSYTLLEAPPFRKRGLRPCDPQKQHKTLSEKENQASSYALPLVGNEQHSSHADKTQLAQNRIDAVQQLHVLSAASLAGFEVIMYGRFCPDHRGRLLMRSVVPPSAPKWHQKTPYVPESKAHNLSSWCEHLL